MVLKICSIVTLQCYSNPGRYETERVQSICPTMQDLCHRPYTVSPLARTNIECLILFDLILYVQSTIFQL